MPKLCGSSSQTEITPLAKEVSKPRREGNTLYDCTSSQTRMSTLTGAPEKANSQKRRFTSPPRVRWVSADFWQWL